MVISSVIGTVIKNTISSVIGGAVVVPPQFSFGGTDFAFGKTDWNWGDN